MAVALVNRAAAPGEGAGGSHGAISTPAANHSAGNLLVAMTSSRTASASISDTAGNTWHAAITDFAAGANLLSLFYAWNITGHASNVVTATWGSPSGGGFEEIVVHQYSGALASSDPLRATASTVGSPTSAIGAAGDAISYWAIGVSSDSQYTNTVVDSFFMDGSGVATGAQTVTYTTFGGIVVATFKASLLTSITGVGAIASLASFGTDRVRRALAPAALTSTAAFGTHKTSRTIKPTGVASTEAFGIDRLVRVLTVSGIAPVQTFGSADVLRAIRNTGAVGSQETVGALRSSRLLSAASLASSAAFGTPATLRHVRAINITTGEVFGATIVMSPQPPTFPSAPGNTLMSDGAAFSVLVSDSETWVVAISDRLL